MEKEIPIKHFKFYKKKKKKKSNY
uniref:Uncharacterized protein n=1 Tax=Anguilla anguilla TaxID=7936 RepID=A0A0E9UAY3_ANGAN